MHPYWWSRSPYWWSRSILTLDLHQHPYRVPQEGGWCKGESECCGVGRFLSSKIKTCKVPKFQSFKFSKFYEYLGFDLPKFQFSKVFKFSKFQCVKLSKIQKSISCCFDRDWSLIQSFQEFIRRIPRVCRSPPFLFLFHISDFRNVEYSRNHVLFCPNTIRDLLELFGVIWWAQS